jgi:hypothetical protein
MRVLVIGAGIIRINLRLGTGRERAGCCASGAAGKGRRLTGRADDPLMTHAPWIANGRWLMAECWALTASHTTLSFFPMASSVSSACESSSRVWVAVTIVRRRALPTGTVG